MAEAGSFDAQHRSYRGSFTCMRAGRYGFTVRIVPKHPHLVTPIEMGLIAWG